MSTHSTDAPAATRNRLLTSVAPSSARRASVVAEFGVRRQAEDRRAEPPERQPGLRVEHRAAGQPVALGQHRLERGHVRVAAQHPVAVVVDEGLLGDVGEQVRH